MEFVNEDEIIAGDMCNKPAINWGRNKIDTTKIVINTFAPATTESN